MDKSGRRVLVLENAADVRAMLVGYLREAGNEVTGVGNARHLFSSMAAGGCDLVVLETRLPDADGLEVAKRLRREYEVRLIIVSSLAAPHHRAAGLEAGADDYIGKPVYPPELLARVANVLQRPAARPAPRPNCDRLGRLSPILTRAEYDVLCCMAASAGRVIGRDVLAGAVMSNRTSDSLRNVDVIVSRLRKKLASLPDAPRISTCRGFGYRYHQETVATALPC